MEDNKKEEEEKNNIGEENEFDFDFVDKNEEEEFKKEQINEKLKRKEDFFNNHKEFLKYKDIVKNEKSFKEKNKERDKRRRLKHREKVYAKVKDMTFEEKDKYLNEYYKEKLSRKAKDREQYKLSYNSNFIVCFDLSYDEYMSERELTSLIIQLTCCYSLNKNTKNKISYYFTNISDKIRDILNKKNADRWAVHYYNKPFFLVDELINLNKEFVYLTPNAEEDLEEVSEDKIYIVGGLVDRTIDRNRSLTRIENIKKNEINNKEYKKEGEKIKSDNNLTDYINPQIKLVARRLPLKKYLDNIKNPILNINTVVEILSFYMDMEKGQKDWKKVFETILPKRKLIV